MHKNIIRGLAFGAVAPLALIGAVGSASAAEDWEPKASQKGKVVKLTCDHPDFAADKLGFQAKIILERDGNGRNFDDIQKIRITATDNQGDGRWKDKHARVKSMEVRYYDFDRATFGDAELQPVVSKVMSGEKVRDGVKAFGQDRDNVSYVEVKVKWKAAGKSAERETLACGLFLDRYGYDWELEEEFPFPAPAPE